MIGLAGGGVTAAARGWGFGLGAGLVDTGCEGRGAGGATGRAGGAAAAGGDGGVLAGAEGAAERGAAAAGAGGWLGAFFTERMVLPGAAGPEALAEVGPPLGAPCP